MKFTTKLKIIGILFALISTINIIGHQEVMAQQQGQISINAIKMNDFYKTAITESENGALTLVKNTNYTILFYPKYKNGFLIALNPETFDKFIKEAEGNLLKILGLTEHEACWLNITISSPSDVEKDIDAKSQRPSFCLGAGHANLNGDSSVNTLDYAIGLKQYGKEAPILSGDLNYDHKVNATDISEIIKYLGQSAN